jgi:hypothetical protein
VCRAYEFVSGHHQGRHYVHLRVLTLPFDIKRSFLNPDFQRFRCICFSQCDHTCIQGRLLQTKIR